MQKILVDVFYKGTKEIGVLKTARYTSKTIINEFKASFTQS